MKLHPQPAGSKPHQLQPKRGPDDERRGKNQRCGGWLKDLKQRFYIRNETIDFGSITLKRLPCSEREKMKRATEKYKRQGNMVVSLGLYASCENALFQA